jgi:hypothetical protein
MAVRIPYQFPRVTVLVVMGLRAGTAFGFMMAIANLMMDGDRKKLLRIAA